MTGKQLKNAILQLAIQGKLVPQDSDDEPASALLAQIRQEKAQLVKAGKLKKKDLATTPITDDEKPFEIPESWEWCRLKDLCSTFSTGPFGTMVHKEDYVGVGGVPLINPTNIKGVKIDEENIKRVNEIKYEELATYILKTGDIVLARRGDLSKCAIVSEKENGWLAGTGAFFLKILELFLPFFVMLYRSPYVQDYLTSDSIGSTMDNLNQALLGKLPIPLPPLAEQKRIVAKIEELMPLVEEYGAAQEKLNRLNEALPEALKKSILQQAIQGKLVPQDANDEPASALLARIRKEKEQLLKASKLKKKDLETTPIADDEKPFEIPESWEWCKLQDLCYLEDGIKSKEKGILLDAKYLRGKSSAEYVQGGKHVSKGDNIILVDGENSGEVFDVPVDGIMGSTFKQLIINPAIYKSYLLMLILFYKDLLRNSKKGAAIPHLNKEIFRNLPISLPPLSEQKRIVAKIEELMAMVDGMK